jgi:hypothetical protein
MPLMILFSPTKRNESLGILDIKPQGKRSKEGVEKRCCCFALWLLLIVS